MPSGTRPQHGKISFTRAVLFETLSGADSDIPVRSDGLNEPVSQSSFADAGFAANKHYLAVAAKCLL